MIDLKQFCGGESELRTWLRKPWAYNGFTYAANGHIMVKCVGDTVPPAGLRPGQVPKNIDVMIARARPGTIAAIPSSLPSLVVCESCQGTGYDVNDDWFRCPSCTRGYKPDISYVNGIKFALDYITTISRLPSVVFRVNGKTSAAHFAFDGGEGLVMPITETADDMEYESWLTHLAGGPIEAKE